jgi:hypothetical protein
MNLVGFRAGQQRINPPRHETKLAQTIPNFFNRLVRVLDVVRRLQLLRHQTTEHRTHRYGVALRNVRQVGADAARRIGIGLADRAARCPTGKEFRRGVDAVGPGARTVVNADQVSSKLRTSTPN